MPRCTPSDFIQPSRRIVMTFSDFSLRTRSLGHAPVRPTSVAPTDITGEPSNRWIDGLYEHTLLQAKVMFWLSVAAVVCLAIALGWKGAEFSLPTRVFLVSVVALICKEAKARWERAKGLYDCLRIDQRTATAFDAVASIEDKRLRDRKKGEIAMRIIDQLKSSAQTRSSASGPAELNKKSPSAGIKNQDVLRLVHSDSSKDIE